MRRACVLRRLDRYAHFALSSAPSLPWGASTTANIFKLGSFALRSRLSAERQFASSWTVTAPTSPSVHPDQHDGLPLPEQLRTVMRLLPHSVVVCTAVGKEPGEHAPTARGMTMSSFTSLTLQPTPIVTFNIATPSRTLDAVAQSRELNIHVLSGDVQGARVADWFRQGNAHGLGVFDKESMWEGCGCESVVAPSQPQRMEDVAAPLLKGGGVLYVMRCKVLDDAPTRGLIRVRDHVVVVAEVIEIVEGENGSVETFGLVYADRQYRAVGNTMAHQEED